MFDSLSKGVVATVSFLIGIALATAGAWFVTHRGLSAFNSNVGIVLPDRNFFESPVDASFVSITGRWSGRGVGYRNNLTQISCDKSQSECAYYSIEQIGPNQIGDLTWPTKIPIKKWDDYEIVASDDGQDAGFSCVRTTINIDRKGKTAELVMEPINQSKLSCARADGKTYKWSMAQSLNWPN